MKPNRKEFNYLYKQMDDLYHDIAVHAGLSDSAFTILYGLLDIGDGCLQKDISSQYSISRQTINSSIKNLEKKGYVSLQQGKHLYLTPAGRRFAEEKVAPLFNLENCVFEQMTPQECSELLRLTRKYVTLFTKKVKGEFI